MFSARTMPRNCILNFIIHDNDLIYGGQRRKDINLSQSEEKVLIVCHFHKHKVGIFLITVKIVIY
jgi:hypothetical protein